MLRKVLQAGVVVLIGIGATTRGQGNLLANPGFETEGAADQAQAWVSSCTGGSKAGRDTVVPAQGKACGHLRKVVDGTSHVAALAQDVAVSGGREYLLTGMVRGRANLFSYEYGEKGAWIRCGPGGRGYSDGWQPVSVRFRTDPKAVRAQVRFEIYGKEAEGEAWVDDVYFGAPVDAPGAPRALAGTVKGAGRIEVSWQAPEAGVAVAYLVFRSRFPDLTAGEPAVARVAGSEWADEAVPDWPRVYYRVAAMDGVHQVGALSPVCRVDRPVTGGQPPAAVVWTCSALEKVRRYASSPVPAGRTEVHLELARNEVEWGQVLITAGQELRGVVVSVAPLQRQGQAVAGGSVALYRAGYTQVARPTLPGAKPGLQPDPLPPLSGAFDIPVDATQAIWVQVHTAAECEPGPAESLVTVAVPGQPVVTVPVRVTVFGFALPETPSFMSAFALWGRFIELAYGVKAGSPEYNRLYESYYWFMVEHRLPPDDLPVPVASPEAARFLNDARVGSFRVPVGWNRVNADETRSVVARLRDQGWLRKGYVYCYDEPTPEQYARCRELADQVHSLGKDVPFLLTEQPEKELFGAVDIWCPILSEIRWDAVEARRAVGERLWWYTCCGPQAPYPTYLVDDIGLSHRVLSWLQALHRVEGVLYWCVNVWAPYREGRYLDHVGVWDEAEMFPSANGDGFLVYPGKPVGVDGPVASVRLEAIRDGNEDVEYVALLRRLLAAKGIAEVDVEARIREIITPVARSFSEWTRDPAVLQAQRRRLAAEIEALEH